MSAPNPIAHDEHRAPIAYTAGGKALPDAEAVIADESITRRFWAKVSRTEGGCWLWTASRDEDGYGSFAIQNKFTVAAHRVAFMLGNRRWPDSRLMVMHTCDNPSCVNPAHLIEGTRGENLTDAYKKNRRSRPRTTRYGSSFWRGGNAGRALMGCSRLTEAEVVMLRQMARDGRLTGCAAIQQAAADFGVSAQSIRDCIRGRTFRHVIGGMSPVSTTGGHS